MVVSESINIHWNSHVVYDQLVDLELSKAALSVLPAWSTAFPWLLLYIPPFNNATLERERWLEEMWDVRIVDKCLILTSTCCIGSQRDLSLRTEQVYTSSQCANLPSQISPERQSMLMWPATSECISVTCGINTADTALAISERRLILWATRTILLYRSSDAAAWSRSCFC